MGLVSRLAWTGCFDWALFVGSFIGVFNRKIGLFHRIISIGIFNWDMCACLDRVFEGSFTWGCDGCLNRSDRHWLLELGSFNRLFQSVRAYMNPSRPGDRGSSIGLGSLVYVISFGSFNWIISVDCYKSGVRSCVSTGSGRAPYNALSIGLFHRFIAFVFL
jgi:hypothetical protein